MKSFLICIGLDPDHSEPIIQHPFVVNPVTLEIPDGICYILYLFSMDIKACRADPVSECQIFFIIKLYFVDSETLDFKGNPPVIHILYTTYPHFGDKLWINSGIIS